MPAIRLNDARLSRRDVLNLAWKGLLFLSGLLGLSALVRFFDYSTESPQPTEFDVGSIDQYPPGSRTTIPEADAFLLHTANGLQALSAECPHLGCTVELAADGFVCPCHTSRFDPQGALVHGPATRALSPLRVEQAANGHVIIHLT